MKTIQPMVMVQPDQSEVVEVEGVGILPGTKVLDAGCGSGVFTSELARSCPSAVVEGCDLSDTQLKQAGRLRQANGAAQAEFFKSSVEKIDRPDAHYDQVICRDVLAMLADPRRALAEFFRVLKRGGRIHALEFDGLFCNLFPATPLLREMLQAVEDGLQGDLKMGRKLPGLMDSAGFDEIQWTVEAVSFQGAALERENRVTEQRFAFAMPALARALGSPERADKFRRLYLEEMCGPGVVMFYNKFVVRGRK